MLYYPVMGMVKPPLLVGKNISSGRKRIYPSWLGHRCTQDRRLHRSRISRRESICRRRPSARASPLAQLPFARFTDLAQIEGFLATAHTVRFRSASSRRHLPKLTLRYYPRSDSCGLHGAADRPLRAGAAPLRNPKSGSRRFATSLDKHERRSPLAWRRSSQRSPASGRSMRRLCRRCRRPGRRGAVRGGQYQGREQHTSCKRRPLGCRSGRRGLGSSYTR